MRQLRYLAPIPLVVLCACATSDQTKLAGAVTTPLADLNVVQAEIPQVLLDALDQTYMAPKSSACDALRHDIGALTAVLGPDLDEPATSANPGLVERGSGLAQAEAIGAVQRTAEGIIPFRGWIRKLTGAERYSKKVAAAIAAGSARRAFLKGIHFARGCAVPKSEPGSQ